MENSSERQGPSPFSVWLRTGFWPHASHEIEHKFNPWHDPENGQFTFAGSGRYVGREGGGSFGGGGATGSWNAPRSPAGRGAGGGGGGASGSWNARAEKRPTRSAGVSADNRMPAATRRVAPAASAIFVRPAARTTPHDEQVFQRVVRNGYEFQIDDRRRTREVSGSLTLVTAKRSRAAQAAAGGGDRLRSDEGGHYIARRFNGPTDAFNHFAQNKSFNRGRYRALEDRWAKAKVEGRSVSVRITPAYDGVSQRPTRIDVWFSIDSHVKRTGFTNKQQEKSSGK